MRGVVWVLHHCHAARLADRDEARTAVVEHARQDDRHESWSVLAGARLEERVDGWPDPVHAGPVEEPRSTFLNHKVVAGYGDKDAPWQ